MPEPKFPQLYLQLSGEDGNLGAIMARGSQLLKSNGLGRFVMTWRASLLEGSYEDALRTCVEWFDVG